MFLILRQLRIFQNIHHHHHGNCCILADGMRIWHLECCIIASTSVLGRRSWPNHPRHSLRTCLHHLLLDTHQPHPMTAIWRSFIWACFVLALNAAFTQQLSLADEGYKSGSNNDLPTPLCKTPHIHHVYSLEHASFDPTHTTSCRTADLPHYDTQLTLPRPVCCHPNIYFWQFGEWPGSRQLIRQRPGSWQLIR